VFAAYFLYLSTKQGLLSGGVRTSEWIKHELEMRQEKERREGRWSGGKVGWGFE